MRGGYEGSNGGLTYVEEGRGEGAKGEFDMLRCENMLNPRETEDSTIMKWRGQSPRTEDCSTFGNYY